MVRATKKWRKPIKIYNPIFSEGEFKNNSGIRCKTLTAKRYAPLKVSNS